MTANERDVAVVIGASNVSRGFSRLVEVIGSHEISPLDLFVTAGHGRSYGVTSSIGVRSLPSILACGLWRDLESQLAGRFERKILGMVTDVGNDLIYGYPPETVAEWVREVVRRLSDRNAKVTMVRLPLASLAKASPIQYMAIRSFFAPWLKLNFEEMKAAAQRLDSYLASIANEFGASQIEQPGEWYGLDAIHIRRRQIHELWHLGCQSWGLGFRGNSWTLRPGEKLALHAAGAYERSVLGIKLETPQPILKFSPSTERDIRIWLH